MRVSYAASLLLLLSACATTENAKKIDGTWRGAAWLVEGRPSGQDATATEFEFRADGNYMYKNSGSTEAGLYQVDGDNLYTTPAGGQQIMVHISKLTKDSLVFDMNRSGRPETLVLLKK